MRPIDDKTIQYIGFSQTDYQVHFLFTGFKSFS